MNGGGATRMGPLMERMRLDMENHCGVFRTADDLGQLADILAAHRKSYKDVGIQDKGSAYNLDLIEALELGHMLDVATAICAGALARQESRGGHYRDDFPKRDDQNWHKHTLASLNPDGTVSLDYKPVRMKPLSVPTVELAERVY